MKEHHISRTKRFQNDLEKYNLRGEVNLLRLNSYSTNQTAKEKRIGQIQSIEFDEYGNILEEIEFNSINGQRELHKRYTYNKRNFVEEVTEDFLDGSLVIEKYSYDENENLIEITYTLEESGLINRMEEHSIEKKVSEFIANQGVKEVDRLVLKYSEKNKLIESESYSENELLSKTAFGYDDLDKVMKETKYCINKVNRLVRNEYSIYNNRGYRIYHEQGNRQGELMIYERHRYNEKMDVLEFYTNDLPEGIETKCLYEYEYDKNGNWTKRYSTINGVLLIKTIREITYYNEI